MALRVSKKVEAKLAAKHQVSLEEVKEAFADRPDYVVLDEREDHASDPPTVWFIAATFHGRVLKVVYVERDGDVHLRTAYPPNRLEIELFETAE